MGVAFEVKILSIHCGIAPTYMECKWDCQTGLLATYRNQSRRHHSPMHEPFV